MITESNRRLLPEQPRCVTLGMLLPLLATQDAIIVCSSRMQRDLSCLSWIQERLGHGTHVTFTNEPLSVRLANNANSTAMIIICTDEIYDPSADVLLITPTQAELQTASLIS